MKEKAFSIPFEGLSLKQIKNFFFEGEGLTLKHRINFLVTVLFNIFNETNINQ